MNYAGERIGTGTAAVVERRRGVVDQPFAALTLLLLYRREKKFALCTLPTWGIIFSLLFSACILIRYSYPFMTCAPMFLLLVLFSDRRAASWFSP